MLERDFGASLTPVMLPVSAAGSALHKAAAAVLLVVIARSLSLSVPDKRVLPALEQHLKAGGGGCCAAGGPVFSQVPAVICSVPPRIAPPPPARLCLSQLLAARGHRAQLLPPAATPLCSHVGITMTAPQAPKRTGFKKKNPTKQKHAHTQNPLELSREITSVANCTAQHMGCCHSYSLCRAVPISRAPPCFPRLRFTSLGAEPAGSAAAPVYPMT